MLPSVVRAATYYVDSAAGNDGNPGISQTSAWRNIPGTYKTDNSGFVSASGWVKLKAGDTILVKSGSAFGSRLVIDSNWYENGTPDGRIRIVRDASWGSGGVIFDGGGITQGNWDGTVHITRVNHVDFDGSEPGGILIKNAKGRGFVASGASESDKMVGLTVRNMKLFNNTGFNVVLQRQDSFLIENVEVDGNKRDSTGGFYIGDQSYGCSNGILRNCRSYNNGASPGSQAGGTDGRIGFWVTNSVNITFEGCVANDNAGDGFDGGVVGNPASTVSNNLKFINCLAYNNYDGFGANLDDIAGEAKFWYINCIARNNQRGWSIYSGPTVYVYNSLAASNKVNGFFLDTFDGVFSRRSTRPGTIVHIKNTIMYGNPIDVYSGNAQDLGIQFDYNLYDQGPGGNTIIAWDGYRNGPAYSHSGTQNIGAWRASFGQDANSGDSAEGKYCNFIGADRNNYHLSKTSAGRGAGVNLSAQWPAGVSTADRNGVARPEGAWDIGPYSGSDASFESLCDYQEVAMRSSLAAPVTIAAQDGVALAEAPGETAAGTAAGTGGGDSGGGGGGGGCFIATAAFGSYLAPEVEVLKDFRDNYLLKTRVGSACVDFYYRVSPRFAKMIEGDETVRAATRYALTPVVYAVKYPMMLFFALPLLGGLGFAATRKRTKA
jgi:hypothetical protein